MLSEITTPKSTISQLGAVSTILQYQVTKAWYMYDYKIMFTC